MPRGSRTCSTSARSPAWKSAVVASIAASGAPDQITGQSQHRKHNTLISDGIKPAWFARVWEAKLPRNVEVVTRNNLTVGLGAFTTTLPGKHAGNMALPPGTLGEAETFDFTIAADSLLRKTLSRTAGNAGGEMDRPTHEFAFPVGIRELAPPAQWVPGAFQSPVIHVN